jgi:hypothetical protein
MTEFSRTIERIKENHKRGMMIIRDKGGTYRAKGRVRAADKYPALIRKESEPLKEFK